MMRSLVLALAMMIGGGIQTYELPAMAASTELKAGSNGHFFVTASINGNSIKAVVDTGASAVVLSYQDAQRAGLRPRNLNYTIPVNTANGMAYAAEVTLREVEIDSVRVEDVRGLVMSDGALNGTLLGMSFLSKLRGFQVEDGRLILKN